MARGDFESVLRKVTEQYDKACFNDELLAGAEELRECLNAKGQHDPSFWEARNLLAEVYDHFGQRSKAEEVTTEAPQLKRMLEGLQFQPGVDTLLRQAQIQHVLFWGQVVYRQQEFETATEIIKFCESFEQKLLDYEHEAYGGKWPHWGTRGLIAYFLGRVYRHQNRLDEAEGAFEESINCYYNRAHDRNIPTAAAYSFYRVAKALALGVGWVKLARGQYREALRQNLIPASVLLISSSTQDELNTQRVLLLEATAECALAGADKAKLRGAIEKLQNAMKVFQRLNHPHYIAKAARELCLAHIELEQREAAQEDLDNFAKAQSGASWKCQHLILSSLVELGRLELTEAAPKNAKAAANFASEALKLARQVLDKIEALIALGRAHFASGDFTMAKEEFLKALVAENEHPHRSKNEDPSITRAGCYLHLARTFAKLGEPEQAKQYFGEWSKVEAKVEHEGLRKLAQQVSKDVVDVGGFVIARNDGFMDYRSRLHQLKRFLVKSAKSRGDGDQTLGPADDKSVVDKLGISALGLKGWLGAFKREEDIYKSLKNLCRQLDVYGETAVHDFERLLDDHGAYTVCRKVLRGEEDKIYTKVFRLAHEHGHERLTIEAIVKAEAKVEEGLFNKSEWVQAEKRLDLLKDLGATDR